MSTPEHDYRRSFGLGHPPDKNKAKAALDLALDIRKFEIGLYWQRAAYFWALIAAAFAGYFAILSADHLRDKEYLAYIVSCIGLVFTWAWFLVNRGSKYWQENWENHVDMLEDSIVGPLYKTILHRSDKECFFGKLEQYVLGPQAISVSKVNLIASIFTISIWITLLLHSLLPIHTGGPISWKHVAVGTITVIFMGIMRCCARTGLDPHKRVMTKRKTEIIGTK